MSLPKEISRKILWTPFKGTPFARVPFYNNIPEFPQKSQNGKPFKTPRGIKRQQWGKMGQIAEKTYPEPNGN